MRIFNLFLPFKHTFPDFLKGKCSELDYQKWLDLKAKELLKRDKRRNKPYAFNNSRSNYKDYIHNAVLEAGFYDPYTGDEMRWDLIGTWDSKLAHSGRDKYMKLFAFMPTVDHKYPDSDTITFEIITWRTNDCKNNLDPTEFYAFCSKVVANSKEKIVK
jgi:hypothetical protein